MIDKTIITALEEEYQVNILIDTDKDLYDYNYINIRNTNQERKDFDRVFKLPSSIDKEWVINKIETLLKHETKKLVEIFTKLNLKGLTYSTSYGIGYNCSFGSEEQFKKDTKIIEETLKKYGIEFKPEFSNARHVLRYKISQEKNNLAKIKNLGKKKKSSSMKR